MTMWRSMVEQLMASKPRTPQEGSSSNCLEDLLLQKADAGPLTKGRDEEEEEEEEEPVCAGSDAVIASLRQKLRSAQTQAKLQERRASALACENASLRKEMEAMQAREQALQRELEQVRRSHEILQEAEERLCTQLAELEAEALDQTRHHTAQLRSLTSQLHHQASASTHPPPSLHLQHITKLPHLQSQLDRDHSLALASLGHADTEIAELKKAIDDLKSEMLRLDSARQTQLNLASKAQKELESLRRKSSPIQIAAAELLFNLKPPTTLLVGAPTCCV